MPLTREKPRKPSGEVLTVTVTLAAIHENLVHTSGNIKSKSKCLGWRKTSFLLEIYT